MGTMQQLEAAGLDVELEAHLAEYFINPDPAKMDGLRKMIDENGLKHPTVMKQIGVLQREEFLKPGIYKEFVALQERLGNGASAAPTPAAPTPAAATPAPQAAPTEGTPTEEPTVDVESYQFSDADEERIKEKLKKEEERMRSRLLQREKKIRERMILGKEKRATRLGLKAEDAAKIEALTDQIKKAQEQKKALNDQIKTCRDEINAIRPKRKRAAVTEEVKNLRIAKRKLTMATKAGDQAEIAKYKAEVAKLEAVVAAQQPKEG
jgi:hypothetical protein